MASGKPNNANILKWFQESLVQIVYGIYASIIFFNSVHDMSQIKVVSHGGPIRSYLNMEV